MFTEQDFRVLSILQDTDFTCGGGGGDTQGNCVGESLVVLGMKQENQSSVYFLVEYQALCILGGRGVKEGFAIKF